MKPIYGIHIINMTPLQNILFEEAKTASSDEREKSLDQIIRKNGWWISSKWAFLNERPVIGPDGTGRNLLYIESWEITIRRI
ncbi:hypothetical protein ACJIZ3_002653 [Penstemon smallii]|uniref:Uncharacterized protein n=1 Tax=Penstemon smallii TaxID=265156 RepID=A0ABD3U8D6_9LAMI